MNGCLSQKIGHNCENQVKLQPAQLIKVWKAKQDNREGGNREVIGKGKNHLEAEQLKKGEMIGKVSWENKRR